MADHELRGAGPPAITPGRISQHYTDDTNKQAYISVGTSSSLDWSPIGGPAAVSTGIHAAPSKSPPDDADEFGFTNSVSGFTLVQTTWANIKATLKGVFDTFYLPITYLDADVTLAANSDSKIATQKAVKTFVNNAVVGLYDDRGNFDASGGAYPSSGGSGVAGAILKGDIWLISVGGTLPTGRVVNAGDQVRALIDTPGNTQANWAILEGNIGYVPQQQNARLTDISGLTYVQGDILYFNGTTIANLGAGTAGQFLKTNGVVGNPAWTTLTRIYTKGGAWSNDASPIVAADANVVYIQAETTGTITKATILTVGGPGSCQIDVWKASYASFPPTVANTITAAALPTVTASNKATDSTLTGWTTAVTAGDILAFKLNSSSNFTNISIQLEITA